MAWWWLGCQVSIDYIVVSKLSRKQIEPVRCRGNEHLINLLLNFMNRGHHQGQHQRMFTGCQAATTGAHCAATGHLTAGQVTLFPGKERRAIGADQYCSDQN